MSQKKLTPDIVSKVIRADLKNIIDKVGSGKPLSGVERSIFDSLNIVGEDLEEKRKLALLSKWANGKRLNESELLEICEHIPDGGGYGLPANSSSEKMEPAVGYETVCGDPVSEELLTGDDLPLVVSIKGYQKKASWYADFYGVSERTVKRWKEVGRKCGEMPQLDDVVKFVEWWSVHMKHKVPESILKLLPAEPEAELDPVAAEPVNPLDLDSFDEVSDMGLSMMRKVVSVNGRELSEAYMKGSGVSRAQKDFDSSVRSLRALEKTHADLAKSGGDLVSKKAVQSELAPIIGRMSSSFLEAMVRVVQTVSPGVERDDALAVCKPERDRCFNALRGELVS